MKTTTVSKLRASLAKYLRLVNTGEEFLVIKRGRPIAKLIPASSSDTLSDQLVEMEKQGLIKIGSGTLPKGFWDLPRPKDPKGLVLKAVLWERETGW
jgi:prevent-host-death family protein